MDAMLAVPLWGARFIEDVDVVTPVVGATKLEAPSNAAPPRTAPAQVVRAILLATAGMAWGRVFRWPNGTVEDGRFERKLRDSFNPF